MATKAIIGSTSRFLSQVNNRVLPTNRTSLVGCFYSAVSSENKVDKKYKVLYDGDCPLCMQEMKVVKYLNDKRRTLDLVNIASPDYKPEDNNGVSYETAMGVMHVIGPDDQMPEKDFRSEVFFRFQYFSEKLPLSRQLHYFRLQRESFLKMCDTINRSVARYQVYTKVDAVHEMYSALGARWMVAYMKWPVLSSLFDKSYMVFARNRLQWTTRWRGECEEDKCQTPPKSTAKES